MILMIDHGLIWPMIVIMQKCFMILYLLIHMRSVVGNCSTVAGGLTIIAIMVSRVWYWTAINHQIHFTWNYYDISTKHGIEYHTKEILNPIADNIPNLQTTVHTMQSCFHRLNPYSQRYWCWSCRCCCCCCRGQAGCYWGWQTSP